MTAFVSDQLRRRNLLGGSFFCRHDVEGRNSSRNLIKTLSFFLCMWSNAFAREIQKVQAERPEVVRDPIAQLFDAIVCAPLRALYAAAPDQPPVVLCVDALDECGTADYRQDILRVFSVHCRTLPPNVKLLVSSRLEPDIVDAFAHLRPLAILPTDENNRDDARRFAEFRLREMGATTAAVDGGDGGARVLTVGPGLLVEKSAGTFIWLVVACKELERFAAETVTLDMIKSLPVGSKADEGVDELYDRTFSRIFGDVDGKDSTLFKVLAFVVCCLEPLTAACIAELLQLELPVVRRDLQRLEAVLIVENERLRVAHKSVKDYLVDPRRCRDVRFAVSLEEQNEVMSVLCLEALERHLHYNMAGLNPPSLFTMKVNMAEGLTPTPFVGLHISSLHSDYPNFSDIVDKRIGLHLRYAALHFFMHCEAASATDRLARKIERFVKEKLLNWLEVVSLLSRLSIVVGVANLLAKQHSLDSDAQALLQDLLRAAQLFYIPVAASALQVYTTVVSFSPSSSALFRQYSPRLPQECRSPTLIFPREKAWPDLVSTLEGHPDHVYDVAAGADGRFFVSSSSDIRVWDAATGELRLVLEGELGAVLSVAVSQNGRFVVSGSDDGIARVWNTSTGELVSVLESHDDRAVVSVVISPDGDYIVSAGADKTARVWETGTGKLRLTMERHTDSVNSVAISRDGLRVASGSSDHTIRVWDPKSGSEHMVLQGHTDSVRAVAVVGTKGAQYVSGSYDNTVRLWDATTGEQKAVFRGHTGFVHTVASAPDGSWVVSGSGDGTIRLWDVTGGSGGQLMLLEANVGTVTSVAVAPDGNHIVSGSSDRTVRVWDANARLLQNQGSAATDRHPTRVTAVAASPSGSWFVSSSYDGSLRVWDMATGALRAVLLSHTKLVRALTISPDSQSIVSTSEDGTDAVWRADTDFSLQAVHRCAPDFSTCAAFSPDGARVASGSRDHAVVVWRADSGRPDLYLLGHRDSVTVVEFSPDGSRVAAAAADGYVRLWRADSSGASLAVFDAHHDAGVLALAFSPDSRMLASGSSDRSVRVWDVATIATANAAASATTATATTTAAPAVPAALLHEFTGHTSSVMALRFSPDSRAITSGDRYRVTKRWDVSPGVAAPPLLSPTAGSAPDESVSFDGQWLVRSGDANG
ncbi:POC1 centriolar protein A, partial [Cladochytrium tenue]